MLGEIGASLLAWLAESQAVQRRLQDRPGIAGVAVDRCDGDDHVEDLLEGEVVADLMGVLRGGEKRPSGGEDAGAAIAENGILRTRPAPGRRLPAPGSGCDHEFA